MQIFVPCERAAGEARVAATPETVHRLVERGHHVTVERAAGARAHFTDEAYERAGASVARHPGGAWRADAILKVSAPTAAEVDAMEAGALLVAFCAVHDDVDVARRLRDRRVSAIAMELIPRVTRAQAMDALSSQAAIAGYKAALVAASHLDKQLPLSMTAAGTIHPARVLVLGAGVAGLSALATCRRLGATVEVSDVREETKEQVESLGGRFVELPLRESGAGEGGYARALREDEQAAHRAVVADRIAAADAVITAALVPGRRAPRLIDEATALRMRPGAVIVDLAVASGGNCEVSVLGETVVRHGVIVVGHPNLPATVPMDASVLYARNVLALLEHVVPRGELAIDPSDEITGAALLTHEGEVLHAPTRAALLERDRGGAS